MLPKLVIFVLTGTLAITLHHTAADDVIKAYSDIDYQASGAQYLRWSIEVYRYTDREPYHICGGSLVTPAVVISAARCFWGEGDQLPAIRFAVARTFQGMDSTTPWHTSGPRQKSDVSTIHLPPTFRDRAGLYADDIAVVTLVTPFNYAGVTPICVSFDQDLDTRQLVEGNYGRNMGTLQGAGQGLPSPLHTALEVPYVSKQRCANGSELYYREQLTPDKICVGFKPSGLKNRTVSLICRSEHGSGLAFYSGSAHSAIPYLRGVASTPFPDPSEAWTVSSCSTYRYAAFTHIASQRAFLERLLPGIEKACGQYYNYHTMTGTTTHEYHMAADAVADILECNCYCNNTNNIT